MDKSSTFYYQKDQKKDFLKSRAKGSNSWKNKHPFTYRAPHKKVMTLPAVSFLSLLLKEVKYDWLSLHWFTGSKSISIFVFTLEIINQNFYVFLKFKVCLFLVKYRLFYNIHYLTKFTLFCERLPNPSFKIMLKSVILLMIYECFSNHDS